MSVYIKGFPLPNNCGACPLRLAWCGERIYMVTRPERCPLVPVPEHGRLIDADALMKIIKAHDYPLRAHFNSTDNGMFTIGIQQAVDETPTIIPADPADKEGEG